MNVGNPGESLSSSVVCMAGSDSCVVSAESTVAVARNPNAKHGPTEVLTGEVIPYEIEYENEGAGIAFGVYVEDYLPLELDESSLVIQNGGAYMPETRSIVWQVGELQPGEKGSVHFQARLRPSALSGTNVINTATVFFPSVPEETPTNPVVSVVGTVIAHPQSVDTNEGIATPIVLSGATVNARPLTYSLIDQPLNGTLSGTPPNLIYTPAANFDGLDRFSFIAIDNDVVSTPAAVTILVHSGPEAIPPEVVTTSPLNGTADVPVVLTPVFPNTYPPFIRVSFSEPLDPATVTTATFLVVDGQGRALPGKVEYDPEGYVARFLPSEALHPDTKYIVTVTTGIKDTSGNHLVENYQWWFHTLGNQRWLYLPLMVK